MSHGAIINDIQFTAVTALAIAVIYMFWYLGSRLASKELADRLENAANAASGILAKIKRAEEIGGVKFREAIEAAVLEYQTDIRQLRSRVADHEGRLEKLTDLLARDYKADVEAGVFEHLAVLARDRANALADKKEL